MTARPRVAIPDAYVVEATAVHRTVSDFRAAHPTLSPLITRPVEHADTVWFGAIGTAIARGYGQVNPTGAFLAGYVQSAHPQATWLMLLCAFELVYPELAGTVNDVYQPPPKPKDDEPK